MPTAVDRALEAASSAARVGQSFDAYRIDPETGGFWAAGDSDAWEFYRVEWGEHQLTATGPGSRAAERVIETAAKAFLRNQGAEQADEALIYWDHGGYKIDYVGGKRGVEIGPELSRRMRHAMGKLVASGGLASQQGGRSRGSRQMGRQHRAYDSGASQGLERQRRLESRQERRFARSETRYGHGIANGGATCYMNAAVALLNDPSLRAQLADEDVEGLEPEDRALAVLRNSLRKRLRDIYTEMDRADHPLHWNRVDKLLRALERYLEATGEVGERWRDLDRAQDLTEPLVYLKRALGVPPIQRRRDPFMDYRLAWLKDRLLHPVPDRDLDRLRGALIRIKAMQESKDLARTGVAPDVDWKQGFMDAARAVYQQDEETNEFQYGINWDEGDQVRLVGEVMYFALHKLELLDVDHNPLAALGRGDEDQVQALIVPGGELVSLEELVGQSGLRRNLRLAAEQPPEGLDLRVERGVVPNGAGSLLGGLMKAISLPTMHGDHEYRVSKIIIHTGGHYFAYVRNPDDPDQWLEVNDSRVVPVSTEMVLNDAASRAYLIRISLA